MTGMRLLFTTRGSSGHVGPLAPVAHAAARAGHEVLVAGQPRHAANVERLGLPFAGLADPDEREWGPLMARLPDASFDEANELMLGEFFPRIDTEAALPPLRELADRWRPGVLVRESWEYASTLVAELQGIPLVRVALGLVEVEELSARLAAPALRRLPAGGGGAGRPPRPPCSAPPARGGRRPGPPAGHAISDGDPRGPRGPGGARA